MRAPVAHYQQTAACSAVLDASPHRLVALMLAGARTRVRLAAACLDRGDVPRKAQAISEASAIIGTLDSTLDRRAGGEVARGLEALYAYMQQRLLAANLHNESAPLQEVDDLLGEIESAWNAITPMAGENVE